MRRFDAWIVAVCGLASALCAPCASAQEWLRWNETPLADERDPGKLAAAQAEPARRAAAAPVPLVPLKTVAASGGAPARSAARLPAVSPGLQVPLASAVRPSNAVPMPVTGNAPARVATRERSGLPDAKSPMPRVPLQPQTFATAPRAARSVDDGMTQSDRSARPDAVAPSTAPAMSIDRTPVPAVATLTVDAPAAVLPPPRLASPAVSAARTRVRVEIVAHATRHGETAAPPAIARPEIAAPATQAALAVERSVHPVVADTTQAAAAAPAFDRPRIAAPHAVSAMRIDRTAQSFATAPRIAPMDAPLAKPAAHGIDVPATMSIAPERAVPAPAPRAPAASVAPASFARPYTAPPVEPAAPLPATDGAPRTVALAARPDAAPRFAPGPGPEATAGIPSTPACVLRVSAEQSAGGRDAAATGVVYVRRDTPAQRCPQALGRAALETVRGAPSTRAPDERPPAQAELLRTLMQGR